MRYVRELTESFDKSDYEKIASLIRNHFSYDEESEEAIIHEMMNQKIDDAYYDILLNSERNDLRRFFSVDESVLQKIDRSWMNFNNIFYNFVYTHSITYDNYRKNKVCIDGKNDIKILKALKRFYVNENIGKTSVTNFTDLEIFYRSTTYYRDMEIPSFDLPLEKFIEQFVEVVYNNIVKEKPSKKDIKIVVSLNFADWFLASTGESWSSCISLNSSYSASFWAGLPSTFVDKKLCVIYITDGQEKSYNGIKSYKMIQRYWGMLSKGGSLNILRGYPSDFPSLIKDIGIDIPIVDVDDSMTKDMDILFSKHEVPFMFNEKGFSQNIYYDNMRPNAKGIIYYFHDSSGHYYIEKDQSSDEVRVNCLYDYSGGLDYLIKYNSSIIEYANLPANFLVCYYTGEEVHEDNAVYIHEIDDYVSEEYYNENFIICECCGQQSRIENSTEVDYERVCNNCLDEYYTYCLYDNEFYSTDEMIVVYNNSVISSFSIIGYVRNENIDDFIKDSDDNYVYVSDGDEGIYPKEVCFMKEDSGEYFLLDDVDEEYFVINGIGYLKENLIEIDGSFYTKEQLENERGKNQLEMSFA